MSFQSIMIGFIIGLAILMIGIIIIKTTKSGFLFEVSPLKRVRCTGEFTGLPHGQFQYIGDEDRMNMDISQAINDEDKANYMANIPDNNDGITDRWII